MLEWYIGTSTGFTVSVGMWGKYFKEYLPDAMYRRYLKTYAGYEGLWDAVFEACALFRTTAPVVGEYLGYGYNHSDDVNMTQHLADMRKGEMMR